MKLKHISTFILLSSQLLIAQTQIENGNFESWENSNNEEQEPNQWSSLKTSNDDSWLNLANQAPQVVWKETNNPHSGNACLKLKVAPYNSLVGIAPNAILTNGRVFASTTPSEGYVYTDPSNSAWNTACTDKPDSLIGWYKYDPQSNDNGRVEVLFHNNSSQGKLPETTIFTHWVGNGVIQFMSTQSTWKRFSFPIHYTTTQLPNYFLIISSAGNGLSAQEGSQLWLDDMSFIYNPPLSVNKPQIVNHSIYAFNSEVYFRLENEFNFATIQLYSLDGKLVLDESLKNSTGKVKTQLLKGIYIYLLNIDGEITTGKVGL